MSPHWHGQRFNRVDTRVPWLEGVIHLPPLLVDLLGFHEVDKTRAYIGRSRSLPLEIVICKSEDKSYIEDAFLLAVPHVKRFKSLAIGRTSDSLRNLTKHLTLPVPPLKELKIRFICDPAPVLDSMLFNEDLSSLRTLSLGGVITHLPWRSLWNLTTFDLRCPPDNRIAVTNLLNFLESAPHLKDITLHHSIPRASNACSSRVVCLPRLKNLTIFGDPVHATLLDHLSIPDGASLVLDFDFSGGESPLLKCLPKTARNLKNLFRITTVNLCFAETKKYVHLVGPSGRFYMFGRRFPPFDLDRLVDRQILRTLNYFSLPMTRRLAITKYKAPIQTAANKSPHCILHRMKDLLTLILTQCCNLPFILALNPDHHPLKDVPCPNSEELVLYIETQDEFNIPELMSMAKERALKGAKLRSITIVGLDEFVPGKVVFKLRKHVAHVEYRFEENPPKWNSIPNDESG
ncbi:hypothetical protein BDM02DRAFT_1761205 [Thelephora ganbajun]|uniref:Uncharacterized protein n=1 Tax=Thelephora ganbajun TaxID=370292 RepID=A0ACB6Z020_THEGA|nr:hypothetical protein BDM02DRAFT_1761205 [Thelephora ganbajun]